MDDPTVLISGKAWDDLQNHVSQIETLMGDSYRRPDRWGDLRRHLRFGESHDLEDIIKFDWPTIKTNLYKTLYGEKDPIPVNVEDLSDLVSLKPKGSVITILKWINLSDEDFERLIFVLISGTKGYDNPEWLMKTNAPDRGRDLSVIRVNKDLHSGTQNSRIIIQCKHWLTKSISLSDVTTVKDQIKLWEPPTVNVLVIATSGRFTSDAVAWIDKYNEAGNSPRIEMWPETHLERLLAARPALIAEFGLK